jgi:hypothetical protein
MAREPKTQEDWMLHAINIHGAFFEAWCRHIVESTVGCTLSYHNYPVEWPERTAQMRGDETELDIRADVREGDALITLLIECKKNNPELTEWVFFPKRQVRDDEPSQVYALNTVPDAASHWSVTPRFERFRWASPVAEDGRETRGNYLDLKNEARKTRTSNDAISSAARQVCTAYRAITHQESSSAQNRLPVLEGPALLTHYRWQRFVPIIVTTANLHLCEFDAADVSPITGELPWEQARLRKVNHLRYDYPLPPALQWEQLPGDKPYMADPSWREPYVRQRVIVVNAIAFQPLLKSIRDGVQLEA